jgi:hypothetical protein
MDNKKLLQQMAKMASVLKKQQKIIEKLAQSHLPGDPLDGDIGDYKAPSDLLGDKKPAPKPPAPAPKPAPKPVAPKPTVRQPTSFTREHPDTNAASDGLPPDLLAALEQGASEFKTALHLEVKGNTVDVGYNTDVVAEKASEVQAKLKAALLPAGYTVTQCIGYSNPGWTPSF